MTTSKNIEPDTIILKKIHSLKNKRGKIVAIEPLSKQWFIGDTLLDALKKAKKTFPDRIFYFEKVGYKTGGMLK